MELSEDVDFDLFYEFCLDWQMNVVCRDELKNDFISYGWGFDNFKSKATQQNYWVDSMNCLQE